MLQRQIRGHGASAPGERHARAAVAVVVNQPLVIEAVGAEDEAGVAMRAQADRRSDDAVPRGDDRRQIHWTQPMSRGRAGPRASIIRGQLRAAAHAKTGECETRVSEEVASSHKPAWVTCTLYRNLRPSRNLRPRFREGRRLIIASGRSAAP